MQKMPIITKRKWSKLQYPFSSSFYMIYGCSFKYVFKRCSPIGLKQPLKGTIFPVNSKACYMWKAATWCILKGSHECFQLIRISYNISCMKTTVAGQKMWNPFRFSFPFLLGSGFHQMCFVTWDVAVTRKSVLLSFQ